MKEAREYVVIEGGDTDSDGYSAYVPDVPGCVAAGDTRDATERLIREAIEFHIEGLIESGYPIPKPTATTERVLLYA